MRWSSFSPYWISIWRPCLLRVSNSGFDKKINTRLCEHIVTRRTLWHNGKENSGKTVVKQLQKWVSIIHTVQKCEEDRNSKKENTSFELHSLQNRYIFCWNIRDYIIKRFIVKWNLLPYHKFGILKSFLQRPVSLDKSATGITSLNTICLW